MHRLLILIALLISFQYSFSQSLELDAHKNCLKDFLKLEHAYGSQKVDNEADYVSEKGVAQPLVFRRKESTVPDLLAYYFYYEKDSAISYILYEWDDTNFKGRDEHPVKSDAEIEGFISKYKELCDQIGKAYGVGKSEGDLSDLSKTKTEGLHRKDYWHPNDSTEIELYTDLSSRYEKQGMITIYPGYHIRLYVKNVQSTEAAQALGLGEEKTKALDLVVRQFFSALKSRDIKAARSFLSEKIVKTTSDTQLKQLAEGLNLEKQVVLFMSGVQMGLDGSVFILLQYKYTDDTNDPPIEMIRVIFDDQDKIAGVQPLKRMQIKQ